MGSLLVRTDVAESMTEDEWVDLKAARMRHRREAPFEHEHRYILSWRECGFGGGPVFLKTLCFICDKEQDDANA